MKIGTNVDIDVAGSIMTIKVDLSEQHGPSSSGKTTIIASTNGNKMIPGGPNDSMRIGLNVFQGK